MKWKILKSIPYKSKQGWNKIKYLIQCHCGYTRKVEKSDYDKMSSGRQCRTLAQQCRKCKEKEYWEENDKFSLIYNDYKQQAKRRGKDFFLSLDQATILFKSDCFYCGANASNIKTHNRNKNVKIVYQGIDRLNPDIGYVLGNVVPACSVCNYAKREMQYSEFTDWINKVHNFGVQRPDRNIVGPSGSKQELPL